MSRSNTKTPSIAGLWTKYVTVILKGAKRPLSTFELLTRFASMARSANLCKPGSSSLLSPPDLTYLDWMANKRIIGKHQFKNRKSDYWSWGLNVTYEHMNDDPAMDQVAIPSSLQPSEASSPSTTGQKPIYKKKAKSEYDDWIVGVDHASMEPFPPGNRIESVDLSRLLTAVDKMAKIIQELNDRVRQQESEIITLKHQMAELEIQEGVDRSKPKTGPAKTVKKASKPKAATAFFMLPEEFSERNKFGSVNKMRKRTGCNLGIAINAYNTIESSKQ